MRPNVLLLMLVLAVAIKRHSPVEVRQAVLGASVVLFAIGLVASLVQLRSRGSDRLAGTAMPSVVPLPGQRLQPGQSVDSQRPGYTMVGVPSTSVALHE